MKYVFLILAALAVAASARNLKVNNLKAFSYTNCNPADPIALTDFSIQPDPVLIPGTIYYSGSITGSVGVTSPTAVDVTLEYKADGATDFTKIDCIDGVFGSCHINDICIVLADVLFPDGCPPPFIENNVPCTCPFEAGTYTIPSGSFEITDELDTVKPGEYRFTAVLTDGNDPSVELQCLQVVLDIEPAAR